MTSPLIVLGVSRSGTTLLRVILDRSPGVAIPDESFFVPLLARRHPRRVDRERFLEDLRRIPALVTWGLDVAEIAPRVRARMPTGEAIAAVFEAYAQRAGKPGWGDKTPMYMRHLPLLQRLFPDARYVHLVRDGRDAALSFLQMPAGTYTRTWAHPGSPAEFACLWRTEVGAARRLGRELGRARYHELRYEDLVADPERAVAAICEFAGVPYSGSMLEYAREVDVSAKPHQQRLRQPPTAGVRDWRTDLAHEDARAFESIAGELLHDLGYELLAPPRPPDAAARLALARYRTTLAAWTATASVLQRSPLWRLRHPRLQPVSAEERRGPGTR